MIGIREEYLSLFPNNPLQASVALAKDLMRGDAESFKAGYTLDNALIATGEVFPEVDLGKVEEVLREEL